MAKRGGTWPEKGKGCGVRNEGGSGAQRRRASMLRADTEVVSPWGPLEPRLTPDEYLDHSNRPGI